MTESERAHVGRVKELPCSVCEASGPSDAHHILEGRVPGRKSPNWCVIPLCKDCHQGADGIHGTRNLWRIYKATELGCLDWTLNTLYGGRA
jgi:hypothetical protein